MIKKILQNIDSFLAPKVCCVCKCNVEDTILCERCQKKFPVANLSKQELTPLKAQVVSFWAVDPIFKAIMYGVKYQHRHKWLKFFVERMVKEIPADFLQATWVPIPISRSRRQERGFNQAEKIIEYISQRVALKSAQLLQRNSFLQAQAKQNRNKRWQNVQNAFGLKKKFALEGLSKDIVLVDDVLTTGSTLLQAALSLEDAGYKVVGALCLGRAESTGGEWDLFLEELPECYCSKKM